MSTYRMNATLLDPSIGTDRCGCVKICINSVSMPRQGMDGIATGKGSEKVTAPGKRE